MNKENLKSENVAEEIVETVEEKDVKKNVVKEKKEKLMTTEEEREDRLAPTQVSAVERDDETVRKGAPLEKMFCGIDSGFGRVKVAYKDSTKGEIKVFNLESTIIINKQCLDIEKTVYINDIPCDTLSYNKISRTGNITKDNEYSIMNMYRAMYELYKRTKTTNFVIGLGASMDTYKSKEATQRLRNRALEKREIRVREHNQAEEVVLTIEDVVIQPECACAIFSLQNVDRLDENYIVDLGTLNSLVMPYHKVPDVEGSVSREYGYDSIVKNIMVKLKGKGINVQEKQVERMIESLSKQDSSIQKIVNEYVIKEFLDKTIREQLKEAGYNKTLGHKLVFTGGTSARFEPHIRRVFKDAQFAKNPLYASVIGMYFRTQKQFENSKNIEQMHQQAEAEKAVKKAKKEKKQQQTETVTVGA